MKQYYLLSGLLLAATVSVRAQVAPPAWAQDCQSGAFSCVEVSGTGTHYFNTSIIHSRVPGESGLIQRSTDTIELEGDIVGRILYHPVSEFDFAGNTLVNTGQQVFSGTVLDSAPVLIYDDSFRFDVNLATGETRGTVKLYRPLGSEFIQCHLAVVGAGTTESGDARVLYSGNCRARTPRAWRASGDRMGPGKDASPQ